MAGGQRPTDDHVADEARETLHQALTEPARDGESDVDPQRVLRGIVAAARELSAARFAALGIVGPGETLTELLVDGLTDAQVERIGRHPRGVGLLGELIKRPRPIRIARIADDPRAHGFPPDHPAMTSFLGVPVFVQSRVFGLLYVADKETADEFADSDERALSALGAAAGVAIENSRLYSRSQRRGRWLEASADITRMLLERANRDDALRAVAKWARELSKGDGAGVLLAAERSDLVIHEVDGDPVDDLRGRTVSTDEPALARVLTDGLPTTVPNVRTLLRAPEDVNGRSTAMSALLVPFRSSANSVGILFVVEPKPAPSREDEYMLQSFADQAAIALDLAQARIDSETVVVLEERDRIARDLHDVVIQRLFATGLMLQGAQRATHQPDARDRIETAVSELDTTIRDLRTAIFELHRAPTSLRSDLGTLISDYTDVLGFGPRLSTRGPVNTVVDAHLRGQLIIVLREALSNVAKHAHASAVDIILTATDRDVVVQVIDNGVGFHVTGKQSGLRNLRERAVAFGGSLLVERAEPHGTSIEWRVPLASGRVS